MLLVIIILIVTAYPDHNRKVSGKNCSKPNSNCNCKGEDKLNCFSSKYKAKGKGDFNRSVVKQGVFIFCPFLPKWHHIFQIGHKWTRTNKQTL